MDTVSITDHFADQVEYPRAAFILYSRNNDQYRFEMRPIKADGRMGAARPVTRKFVSDIAETFSVTRRATPHGEIPDRLLYADPHPGREAYVWYSKPQKRHLMFSEQTGIEDGDFRMPGTLYVVRGESLYVFCFAGTKPDRKKHLLTGPFFNTTYPSGSVCLGSARGSAIPDNPSWESLLLAWERRFWNSVNVHPGGGRCVKGTLKDALESCRKDTLDLSLLIETDRTLEKILRDISNGKTIF